ncbi:MAG TPA: DUF1385 domain-containing protein [Egibacteraceae bacterium]|nr:DUF1385 domain-containing protein [Actinomycetota bacterium]HWB71639.1 DUF1385 domain-containing protein [Egibacteraceae bacterium]
MPSQQRSPHYYGGQAVIEGVMMRGARTWAVAVRRPGGDIWLERHRVSDLPQRVRLFSKPLLRGMFALVDALAIGMRALTISANQSVEEDERLSSRQVGSSLAIALLLFVGVFIVVPNVGLAAVSDRIGGGLLYHVVEGVVRIAIFLAYLFAISLLADIRRVFQYHGAEHKTIAAWEHGGPLAPAAVEPYSTLHVRCGTNFLLMVMLVAIVLYSVAGALVPAPDAGRLLTALYHIMLRVLLLPVVAGVAYEGLRLGAGRDNLAVRALMKPGLWLQMITTKPPTPDQVEVAIRAFEAVVPEGELAGRRAHDLPSPVVWGPDEAPEPLGPADVTGTPIHQEETT